MNGNSRIHNSIKNIYYGLLIAILNTLVSFVSRTFLVKILGSEILGINGLFTEVIAMMSLAELGVGMAIIYSLYKPINEANHKKISQLMSLYRTAYNVIALVTFVIGLAITPFVNYLITDVEYPASYIRLVFMLFVVKTSSTYLLSYKTALLNADQKQYIVSTITVVGKVITTAFTIVILILFNNYILYLVLLIAQSLITNGILAIYVDKQYPFLNSKDRLSKEDRNEVLKNIKNIFVKRVSGVITSSTDNILISTLVSTIQVGIYSNYVMIFAIVRTLKQQFTNGLAASIGNLSVTEKPEKCIDVLKKLTFFYFIFACIMTAGLMAISNTFVSIWLGSEYVMKDTIVYLAVFNLFLEIICEPLWKYLEVSGLFKQDKNIGIAGSTVNLIVSILLGLEIGIEGIFIGTVCTQVIQLILKIDLLFKHKFYSSPVSYYVMWIKMFAGFCFLLLLQIFVINKIAAHNIYVSFIVKGVVSVFFALGVSVLVFVRSKEYVYSKEMLLIFAKKMHKCARRNRCV